MFYRLKDYFSKYERRMRRRQRIYSNPYSEECFSLNYSICEFIIPRLYLYKKEASQMIEYDFTKIDKMIAAFELYRDRPWEEAIATHGVDEYQRLYSEVYLPQIEEGMKLFKDEFLSLWW